eukprot:g39494.t1
MEEICPIESAAVSMIGTKGKVDYNFNGVRLGEKEVQQDLDALEYQLLKVYDIAFSRAGGGRDMFASVGADGSVRMFDLRHLEHSTIIYEDPQHHPLLRLCWNKQDPNYLATMAMDGME